MPRADLHVHTLYSDGTFTPRQIVELAVERGLTTVALTDHDTVDGVSDARPDGFHFTDEAATALSRDWLGPLLIQAGTRRGLVNPG